VCQAGELISFDTDMIGPYGYCADVSRAWTCGYTSGQFEPGMVVCVESLIAEAGSESVKLETQVLVTESGYERLDTFPFE